MGRFSLEDLGQPISLRAAREYLAEHGWRLREDGQRLVCEGPPDDEGRPVVQFLPADESFADYPLRVEDLIATLSVLEDRPAVEIAAEITRLEQRLRPTRTSLADELIDELRRGRVQLTPGQDPTVTIDKLRPLLLAFQDKPTRHVALLAARFAGLFAESDASKLLLWHFCERLLSEGGLRLTMSPGHVDELYALALADDPGAPDEVLDWIEAHLEREAERKKPRSSGAENTGAPSDSGRPVQ